MNANQRHGWHGFSRSGIPAPSVSIRAIRVFFVFFALFVVATPARCALVTYTVTITNTPLPGAGTNLVVNGITRNWTNAASLAGIQTNSAGINESATNLFRSWAAFPQVGVTVYQTATNAVTFRGLDITVTQGGIWASITSTSAPTSTTTAVTLPMNASSASQMWTNLDALSTNRNLGRLNFTAGIGFHGQLINTNYTLTTNDLYVGVNSITNTVAITLPLATNTSGQIWVIHDDAGAGATNAISLVAASGDRVNGATNYVFNGNYEGALIVSRGGTNFYVYATGGRNVTSIPRSYIASGTAEHVVINDGSGNLSSEATLGAARFPALTGDVTSAGGSLATTIAANAVALTTDTTGNYVADVSGTANEVTVSHTPGEGSTATVSLPATIDLGGKTSFEIPNAAGPTVDAFGEIAGDNDLWAASRGAPVFFDGTAPVGLIGALVSDAPSNGQVPKWNTGGTITWESDNSGGAGQFYVNESGVSDGNFTNTSTLIWGVIDTTNVVAYPTNLANAQISASAAIAKSKVSTTGTWTAAEIPTLQTVADGGANTIKMKGYIVLASPFSCDGAGAVIVTNNNSLAYFGQALMSGTAATNANFIEYRITVPEDIDTAIDLKVERWKIRLSGADTGAHTYNIAMASVADSATYDSPTLGQWVALSFAGDASGASGDVETVSNVTLTDWKSNVTAGRLWVIRVNRDGAGDASTVAAYSGPLVISYGITQ